MSTEEQKFIKNLVQRSGIRRGLPNTVIGFGDTGIPEATPKAELGGIDSSNVADPFTDFWFYDEFFYPRPATEFPHWEKTVSPSVPNNQIGGIIQIQTGASANNLARINLCGGGLVAVDITKKWKSIYRIRLLQSDQACILGLTPEAQFPASTFPFGSRPTPYVQFFYNGSGNWLAQSHNGSTPNSTDTGIAGDTLAHVFEINFDPATSTLTYLIDSVQVATFNTNIPTGLLANIFTNQTATGAKQLHIDSFFVHQVR